MEQYRIVIAGDTFPRSKNLAAFEVGDVDQLLDSRVLDLLDGADYRICNLEGCFIERGANKKQKSGPVLGSPTTAFSAFEKIHFDSVCVANNHVTDYGKGGYDTTVKLLEKSHIGYFGAGYEDNISKSLTVQAGTKRVVIYAVAQIMFNKSDDGQPGANLYDEYRVCNELKELKKTCDYLVVLFHGGPENYWYGSPILRQRFHRMADSGADVVIGQHSHCIGIQENYNGSYLLYGQGNFLFAQENENEYTKKALLLCLNVSDTGLTIERHLVQNENGKTSYIEQDFSDYDSRNAKFAEGYRFEKEYNQYCDALMYNFLIAFRGNNIIDRIMQKVLSRRSFLRYLRNQYSDKQLLRIINAMQSDQFNELITDGLWNIVKGRTK